MGFKLLQEYCYKLLCEQKGILLNIKTLFRSQILTSCGKRFFFLKNKSKQTLIMNDKYNVIDPLGRPLVTTGSDNFLSVYPS